MPEPSYSPIIENLEEIGRKHPARQHVFAAGNLSPIVFLTVCSAGRKPILATPDVHALLLSAWNQADRWSIGRYVILPDHIHMFCSPATLEGSPIKKWVQFWKALVSRGWPRPEEHPVWQIDAWDTQLRREDNYASKWEYVRNNPVRHGLAPSAGDWPFQGEIHVLPWHDQ